MTRVYVSKSRTYVAMCNKASFDGFYFRRFWLPLAYENNHETASWYFLNTLNFEACLEVCFPIENLGPAGDLVERQTTWEERNVMFLMWRMDEAEGPVQV